MSRAANQVGAGRLLFRFGLGAAELVGEGLAAMLHVFEEAAEREADDGPAFTQTEAMPPEPVALRHVLIGAADAAPAWAQKMLRRSQPGPNAARALARRGRRVLARAPGVPRLRRRADALRAAAEAQLARWAEVGQREERAGRTLARLALSGLFELGAARLAESPELRRLIAEQSEGLTESALAELRTTSARADGAVEAIARRVLRRPPRRGP